MGRSRQEPIAIVGMACRFPQAADVRAFWRNLVDGTDCITRFDEWDLEIPSSQRGIQSPGGRVLANGVLDRSECFDAEFFGISNGEAKVTDPQLRLALEVAWHCLEDAGCDPDAFRGDIGAFTAASLSTYLINNLLPNFPRALSVGGMPVLLRNDKDNLATFLAYKLGLSGPALNVGSGCSGGLAAVELAAESLASHRCDMALCGAASVIVPQRQGHLLQKGGVYSTDGYCRPFDALANGTVGSSGVAFVALKRLEDAVADGDAVYATIVAGAINNDGSRKLGYTAPSPERQADLLTAVYEMAGVSADAIGMIEAHATATELGDPAEFEALVKAFRKHTRRTGFCSLGSVKSNIGHTDVAAGMAGLIKAVLAIHHGHIPGTVHFATPGPAIALEGSPFYISARATEWNAEPIHRYAGVTALGMGGTNVHLLLRGGDAPRRQDNASVAGVFLLAVSAQSQESLRELRRSLVGLLAAGEPLASICAGLATRRRALRKRFAIVVSDAAQAQRLLLDPSLPRGVEATGEGLHLLFDEDTSRIAAFEECCAQVPGVAAAAADLWQAAKAAGVLRDWRRDTGLPADVRLCLYQVAWGLFINDIKLVPDGVAADGRGMLAALACTMVDPPKDWLGILARRLCGGDDADFDSLIAEFQAMATRLPIVRLDDRTRRAAEAKGDPAIDGETALAGAATIAGGDMHALLDAVGARWARGERIELRNIHRGATPPPVELPEYPFVRTRHWMDPPAEPASSTSLKALGAGLRRRYRDIARRRPVEPLPVRELLDAVSVSHFATTIARVLPQGEQADARQLASRLALRDQWRPMLRYMLSALAAEGYLSLDAGALETEDWMSAPVCRTGLEIPVVDAAHLAALHPACSKLLLLVDDFGSRLDECLSDTVSANKRFGDSLRTGELTDALAQPDQEFSSVGNIASACAQLIERIARARRGLRVLEIGAGTLMFTQHMIDALRAGDIDYVISDINPVVVAQARSRCMELEMPAVVATAVVDVERPLPADLGKFDMVVGLNVVHACADVDAVLGNLRQALEPGGYLLLMESVDSPHWQNLVWGLADGWWKFSDARRTLSPLMDAASWGSAIDALSPSYRELLVGEPVADAVLLAAQFENGAEPTRGARQDADLFAIPERLPSPDSWLYEEHFVAVAPAQGRPLQFDVLVVLAGRPGSGSGWMRTLASADRVVSVHPDDAFARHDDDAYGIRPGATEDMQALFDSLEIPQGGRVGVLHAWSDLGEGAEERPAWDEHALGIHSLISIAQAIGDGRGAKWRIVCVTHGIWRVTGEEELRSANSLLLAPVKVIPLEYPNVSCVLVDIAPADRENDAELRSLAGVLDSPTAPAMIAWRNGRAWRQTFSAFTDRLQAADAFEIRPAGSYVIFGGLGGVGSATARFLARDHGARLLLVGRHALPEDDGVRALTRQIEELGGQAHVFAADVCRLEDVEATLAQAERLYGAVHGVIHSAGVIDRGGVMHRRDADDTQRAIASKVAGARNIEIALRGRSPDFVLFYASLGCLLYKLKFGEVGYVAGNDFLASFTLELSARARYAVRVIHWTDWQQSGMWNHSRRELLTTYKSEGDDDQSLLMLDVLRPMSDEEGQEVLRLAIRSGRTSVIVSTQPMDELMAIHDAYTIEQYGRLLESSQIRRQTSAPASIPAAKDETAGSAEKLRAIWTEVLNADVRDSDDFFDLGGDSLLALRVIARVNEDIGCELPLSTFFTESKFGAMSGYLRKLVAN